MKVVIKNERVLPLHDDCFYIFKGVETFLSTEQVYDLSKISAKQLTGLLKNCLVKPVTELPKPKGYDQWVADGKQMPVILSTDKKIDLNSLVNSMK